MPSSKANSETERRIAVVALHEPLRKMMHDVIDPGFPHTGSKEKQAPYFVLVRNSAARHATPWIDRSHITHAQAKNRKGRKTKDDEVRWSS